MSVADAVYKSKSCSSELSFTLSDLVKELGCPKESIQRGLAHLVAANLVFEGYSHNRKTYIKAVRHWIHKQRLANYDPPRPAKNAFLSPWLVREGMYDS